MLDLVVGGALGWGLLLATHQESALRVADPSLTLARLLSVVGTDAVLASIRPSGMA
ncbi:hypothetical protein [Streptomyces sp. NPDC001665]